MSEYFYICILCSCIVNCVVLISMSVFLTWRKKDEEKVSPYECGFMPFRMLGWSLMSNLFGWYIVCSFGFGVVFFVPLLVILGYVGFYGLLVMFIFCICYYLVIF